MFAPLEFVRAVGAQADDVLEEDLIVGRVRARLVLRVLEPDAAELARAPVHHDGVAGRGVLGENRGVRGGPRSGIAEADGSCARLQPLGAVARAPPPDGPG